jgi:hypothetical protein
MAEQERTQLINASTQTTAVGNFLFDRINDKDIAISKLAFGAIGTVVYVDASNPLPVVAAATDALLTTIDADTGAIATSAASIDTKTPALGQAEAAASVPVVLPADQVTTLTPPAAITGFATAANQLPDGHNVTIDNASIAVTGPLTDTELRATAVPVSGTVDLGAADNAVLDAIAASVASVDGKVTAANTGAVTISSALPAGTNNIGDVDVLSLPALAAGSNTIGAVNLAQYTPASGRLPVDGSGVTQPVSGTFWQTTQPVSGTVTAELSATDNAVLDAIASPVVAMGSSVSGAENGFIIFARDMDDTEWRPLQLESGWLRTVTAITLPLPAGTNNIGDVDVLSLPALPTGTNSIGQVTANAGTNLNTSALALESGGNLAAIAGAVKASGAAPGTFVSLGAYDAVDSDTMLPLQVDPFANNALYVSIASTLNAVDVNAVGPTAHDASVLTTRPVIAGARASATAPSDVSLDDDATYLWALRNGSLVTNLAVGGTLVTASAGLPVAQQGAWTAGLSAGTNLIGKVSKGDDSGTNYSGTTALTVKYAAIAASSSGNNTIVAAVTSKKIRVLAYNLMGNGAVNAKWQSGAGGTDLTGLKYIAAAGGGICAPYNKDGWFETASGALLNLNLSGAVAVGGELTYIEV